MTNLVANNNIIIIITCNVMVNIPLDDPGVGSFWLSVSCS